MTGAARPVQDRDQGPDQRPVQRPVQRLDKYLWQARFFKSRTQAAAFVAQGRLRLDGAIVAKPNQAVRIGCVLTFPLGSRIRVVRVRALGGRRGPPAEARTLYEDLDEQSARSKSQQDAVE